MKYTLFADGVNDDTLALQEMLDMKGDVIIKTGDYRVKSTLIIGSDTHIKADENARIFMCGEVKRKRGDFLLSTDPEKLSNNISISGGIWDGNNASELIRKADIFDFDGYSGTVLNFCNVKNLSLDNIKITNPAAYYARFCKIDGFSITDISLISDLPLANQDGLHFCGEVRNGRIENISAFGDSQTNDDMIAFNADDYIDRVENLDMVRGDIENITVKNISAQNCHTFIRLLSVYSTIKNITIENVTGGCKNFVVNMDAGRYCRTPICEGVHYQGVGNITNVNLRHFKVHWSDPALSLGMILCETQMDNLEISDFIVDSVLPDNRNKPTIVVKNIYKRVMKSPLGKTIVINNISDKFEYTGNISNIRFTKA